MTLTKRMDWNALFVEAERQWNAGNSAGVRYFCRQRLSGMPAKVRDQFFLLLCTDPKAKASHRPRAAKAESGAIIIDYFRVPDSSFGNAVKAHLRMAGESAAHELLGQLRQARATGDDAFLRKHKLHNIDGRSFPRRSREYVEKKFHLLKK